MDIKNLREEYCKDKIDFENINPSPVSYFKQWLNEALKFGINDANACVLSTISKGNIPKSRVVLLKNILEDGFVFFTNYKSHKSKEMQINNCVALNFFWKELERQIRVNGVVSKISDFESDEYFKSRPYESQIGAWASYQSKSIDLLHNFANDLNELEKKFNQDNMHRPDFWGGYIIKPNYFEFWQGRPARMHDRLVYEINDGKWVNRRLSP